MTKKEEKMILRDDARRSLRRMFVGLRRKCDHIEIMVVVRRANRSGTRYCRIYVPTLQGSRGSRNNYSISMTEVTNMVRLAGDYHAPRSDYTIQVRGCGFSAGDELMRSIADAICHGRETAVEAAEWRAVLMFTEAYV